jgi:molybdenum-dependent DNA-binding transcriptional regulator ModE
MPNGLTTTQRRYVEAAAKSDSIAAAGRALGTSRKSAHEVLTKPNVARALAARLERESDKATGEVGRLRRLTTRCLDAFETILARPDELTFEQAGAAAKMLMDATLQAVKLADALPQPGIDPATARDRERRRTARAMRAALWLAAGRSLLGLPPLVVVEQASIPPRPTDSVKVP